MILTIKANIHPTPQTEAVLKDAMRCATKVYNGLLWHLRKEYEETGKTNVSRKNLNRILKELPRTKGYYSMSVQLTRDEVIQAYKSFFELRKQGLTQHYAPGFRRKNDLSPLKYVQSGFKVKGNKMTLSLETSRQDGVKSVSFRISHRPHVQYERIRQLSIVYDKISGQLEARLMVEVQSGKAHGSGRMAIDLGETILMTCAFHDGTISLYSGRQIKAIRRYCQKVRANFVVAEWHGLWPCPTFLVGMVSLNRSTVLNCTHPDRMPPNLFGGELALLGKRLKWEKRIPS